jgi:hypothetical protein
MGIASCGAFLRLFSGLRPRCGMQKACSHPIFLRPQLSVQALLALP